MNKTDSIRFEQFAEKDVKEVLALWKSISGIYLHHNGEDSEEGIIQYLRRNAGFSHVAKTENRIIGALMCGHDGRRGLIHHLGVDQNYRRVGIAKKLLDLSLEKLRAVNIRKCIIFVLKENKEARKFYEHIGWVNEQKADIYSLLLHRNQMKFLPRHILPPLLSIVSPIRHSKCCLPCKRIRGLTSVSYGLTGE